jgi:hypothetical protein
LILPRQAHGYKSPLEGHALAAALASTALEYEHNAADDLAIIRSFCTAYFRPNQQQFEIDFASIPESLT